MNAKKNIKHKIELMKTGWNKKLPLAETLISRFDNYRDMKKPVLQRHEVDYLIVPEASI